jgi:hypothetical protein
MKALGQGIRIVTQKYYFLLLYSSNMTKSIRLDNIFVMTLQ